MQKFNLFLIENEKEKFISIVLKIITLLSKFILIFILGGALAFIGDLLISFQKRENNIKDTGSLLPGHGGILDRLDSHLLATPIILILMILVI